MNPLKVLWIDCSPFCGGAQQSFAGMIRALLENDSGEIEGRLYYAEPGSSGWGGSLQTLPGLAIRYSFCRHWNRSLKGIFSMLADILRWHWLLEQEIRSNPPDLIHVNCCRAYLLLPWLSCRHIPVVVHDRDFRKPGWLMRLISWRRKVRVFTVSRWLGEEWSRKFPRVHWNYVPNPVETPSSAKDLRTGDIPVFAMIADWAGWKRHEFFIRALACYREQFGPCRGLIQGRMHDARGRNLQQEAFALRAHLGLEDCLEISENRSAPEILSSADVLVSCAEEEPFGRTVVEALQQGRSVAAMKRGGPGEILEGCAAGFLSEGSVQDFAVKMHEARRSCRREEVILAARSRGLLFLPALVSSAVRRIYVEILEESHF